MRHILPFFKYLLDKTGNAKENRMHFISLPTFQDMTGWKMLLTKWVRPNMECSIIMRTNQTMICFLLPKLLRESKSMNINANYLNNNNIYMVY
jgi:hypothetical protein